MAPQRPWIDRGGCLVRIDVLAERPGPEHCGWQGPTVLIAGRPLGTRYAAQADTIEYVRDPDQVFGRPQLAQGFEPHARLPDGAADTGFRRRRDDAQRHA